MTTPKNVTRALKNYGEQVCRKAYRLNSEVGEGAASIALQVAGLNTTRQADAAINAGRWLATDRFYGDSEINNSRAASAFDAFRSANDSF
jgi:hypothetical protein